MWTWYGGILWSRSELQSSHTLKLRIPLAILFYFMHIFLYSSHLSCLSLTLLSCSSYSQCTVPCPSTGFYLQFWLLYHIRIPATVSEWFSACAEYIFIHTTIFTFFLILLPSCGIHDKPNIFLTMIPCPMTSRWLVWLWLAVVVMLAC